MPGDLTEYREQASRCLELARKAEDSSTKEIYANLAASWLALAEEWEKNGVFLREAREAKNKPPEPEHS
jgi:hypothetical protein